VGAALDAIDRVVASVTDPTDRRQQRAAVALVSASLIDDVVFGDRADELGGAADGQLVATGIGASPGLGIGVVCEDIDSVFVAADAGREPVLLLDTTSPADEVAMRLSAAVVTRGGGMTSHAAIVARHLGLPAVCGVGTLALAAGDTVMVDGATGEVRRLDGPAVTPDGGIAEISTALPAQLQDLLEWGDHISSGRLRVVANADTAEEVAVARSFGASGVGLARMERLVHEHRDGFEAVLAADAAAGDRVAHVVADHVSALCAAMVDGPIRLRLLDIAASDISPTAHGAGDPDPSLGLRGVRLGILHEHITRAQVRGVLLAITDRGHPAGVTVELTVPLVSDAAEMEALRSIVDDEADRFGRQLRIGAMIETPRACLVAPSLARQVGRFSFGTNDLTQLTYGLSRDIADSALGAAYRRLGVWERNPFETLDTSGVTRLIALAVESGRAVNPALECTLCGEHAADPASIAVALALGIGEVSVSPYRVPATRLAVAHAVSAAVTALSESMS